MHIKRVIIGLCLFAAMPGIALAIQREAVVKLSPQMRVSDVASAPMSKQLVNIIKPLLKNTLIINTPTLDSHPYIVAFPGKRITAVTGEPFYARGPVLATMPAYLVVRPGEAYSDPQTKEILAYALNPVAKADLQAVGDPASLVVAELMLPIAIGDRLIPWSDVTMDLAFAPRVASAKISGQIMAMLGADQGLTQGGQYSIAVINRGSQAGVQLGDVLTISTAEQMVSDPVDKERQPLSLPRERLGQLLIFKVYERLSFGLITETSGNIQLHDWVGNT